MNLLWLHSDSRGAKGSESTSPLQPRSCKLPWSRERLSSHPYIHGSSVIQRYRTHGGAFTIGTGSTGSSFALRSRPPSFKGLLSSCRSSRQMLRFAVSSARQKKSMREDHVRPTPTVSSCLR